MLDPNAFAQQPQQPALGNLQAVRKPSESFLQDWLVESTLNQKNDLAHAWRGHIKNDTGHWVETNSAEYRIMNEKGIRWAMACLDSLLGSIYQSSNFDKEYMNWQMRANYRTVWWTLVTQYRKFDMKKNDVPNVARSILHLVEATLLAARGEGVRKFLSTTTQQSEVRSLQQNEKSGFFSGISSALRRNEGGQ